jgi:hypothetical protein
MRLRSWLNKKNNISDGVNAPRVVSVKAGRHMYDNMWFSLHDKNGVLVEVRLSAQDASNLGRMLLNLAGDVDEEEGGDPPVAFIEE